MDRQTERDYRDALDALRFSGEGKERIMKNLMAEGKRPVKAKRFKVMRAGLIAAALCVALVGTAFAASPGLRDMLAEVLGSFAPYAQKQDDTVYMWNGFEFKVMAALADENTIRVYVQARDTEGKHRLDVLGHSDAWLAGGPDIGIHVPETSVQVIGGMGHTGFEPYDAETQTAMTVTTLWGMITDDLTGAELRIDTPYNMMDAPGNAALKIPLDIEIMPSKTLLQFQDMELDGMRIEELRVSPLGITAVAGKDSVYTKAGLDTAFRVRLKDGTEIKTETDGNSGYGSYQTPETGDEHQAFIWNFADPVELDEIDGVYIGEDYFPVK